jgi:hypothetical protein
MKLTCIDWDCDEDRPSHRTGPRLPGDGRHDAPPPDPVRSPGCAWLSRTPGSIRRSGPDIGEDTHAVLHGIGLTDAQIDAMRAAGVLTRA